MFGAVTTLKDNELSFATGQTREEIDAKKAQLEVRESVARGFVQEGQELSRFDKFLGRIGRAVSFDHK